eukprot:767876-Hanusia_phi.AAC.14
MSSRSFPRASSSLPPPSLRPLHPPFQLLVSLLHPPHLPLLVKAFQRVSLLSELAIGRGIPEEMSLLRGEGRRGQDEVGDQHRRNEDRTGPDRTGQHSTAKDRTGQDRTEQNSIAKHRTGQDRTGQDRTGQDRTGQDIRGARRSMSVFARHVLLLAHAPFVLPRRGGKSCGGSEDESAPGLAHPCVRRRRSEAAELQTSDPLPELEVSQENEEGEVEGIEKSKLEEEKRKTATRGKEEENRREEDGKESEGESWRGRDARSRRTQGEEVDDEGGKEEEEEEARGEGASYLPE